MHLINLIVNYLYRKFWEPLHNFFENWSRGTSHLNLFHCSTGHVQVIYLTYIYFRRLHFDIQIKQGQTTHLIETCYSFGCTNTTFNVL